MTDTQHMNGRNFYYFFLAGAQKVLEAQKEINKMNVFPVPDADTGTNLASTMRSVIENVRYEMSFKDMTNSIALAALDGARGNSGVIFAQFLHGLNKETDNTTAVNIQKFAKILIGSIDYIYEAVANPVEGTMLTVMREWAQSFHKTSKRIHDFSDAFIASIEEAQISLKNTASKLKELTGTHIEDAGGKGFVVFLEGIAEFIKTKNLRKILASDTSVPIIDEALENISHDTLTYRYCTEATLKGAKLDLNTIRKIANPFGDSMVVAGSDEKVKLHIHTDEPHVLFAKLASKMTIASQKVDDMKMQFEVAHNRKSKIAIVTDSACDLSSELMEKYQIHMISINLNIDNSNFLDKVTIQPEQVYELLDKSKEKTSTSQPNEKAFENLYSFLCSHYDSVISIHLASQLSGTFRSSERAAKKISKEFGKSISVIDSKHLSGSLGLMVLRAAQEVEQGKSHDDIVRAAQSWSADAKILVSVKNLKYMIRGGRVPAVVGRIAQFLHINPIVSLDETGKSHLFDKAFGQKANIKKALNHVRKMSEGKEIWNYIVLHADNELQAGEVQKELEQISGKKPVSVVNISPVIGMHAGRGAVALAFMTN